MKPWLRPEPALSLALLRIVIPLLMLIAPGFEQGVHVAGWDPARFVVPEGLGWFVAWVPIRPDITRIAQAIMLGCAALSVLGVATRAALLGLLASAFYLYSIAQLTGFVWHDMHLLWFTAILAASPCDDVLAWDARYRFDHEHVRYAPSLTALRLSLGVIYFFPGLRKLTTSGVAWITSDNLQNQLHWKWLQHDLLPAFRPDTVPGLLQVGGAFVVLFELSFVFLVLWPKARPWLALAGLGFHLLSQWIFRIPFASLWLCYVVLVDPRPAARRLLTLLRRAESVDTPEDEVGRRFSRIVPWIVGGAVVLAAAVQGARGQMRSYPFACYPTFEWRAASVMPDLGIVARMPDGTVREVRHGRTASGKRSQRKWAELWSLAGVYGPPEPARLHAYLRSILREPGVKDALSGAESVVVTRDALSVRPADRGKPPVRRQTLLAVKLRR